MSNASAYFWNNAEIMGARTMLLGNEQAGIHGHRKQHDSANLDKKVEKAIRETGRGADEIARMAAIMVCESAGKITPPGNSYQISDSKFLRKLIKLYSKTGSLMGYAVSVRATDRKFTKKFLFKDYASRQVAFNVAGNFREISNRGVSKAGWWLAIQKLKGSAPNANYGRLASSHFSEINAASTTPASSFRSAQVSVTNMVKSISRFGDMALRHGLRSARIRLDHWLSDLRAKTAKAVK